MKLYNVTIEVQKNEVVYLMYGYNSDITLAGFDSDEDAKEWAKDYHKMSIQKIWPEIIDVEGGQNNVNQYFCSCTKTTNR